MYWDHAHAFLAVVREGSLTGAARALGLAQPTVRRRIEELESDLAARCSPARLPGSRRPRRRSRCAATPKRWKWPPRR
jgi:Bacterial regulatory helix-turn-helix protein, lysR family